MKFIFWVIIAAGAIFLFFQNTTINDRVEFRDKTPTLTPTISDTRQPAGTLLTSGQDTYRGVFYRVPGDSSIRLIPNFSGPQTSLAVYEEERCTALINGNFYTPERQPLGLFIADGKTWAEKRTSATFNGFVWQSGGRVAITNEVPASQSDWIVQSGPVLVAEETPRVLQIRSDEPARRVALGVAKSGDSVFMAFTGTENTHDGPFLTELPQLVQELSEKQRLGVTWAINMDGGSASAFISPETTLAELTDVGSFLCAKR